MATSTSTALYFTGPRDVELRERDVADPGEGEVRVRAERSAISPGTELLVYRDEVPERMAVDDELDALTGTFEFPLRYGYSVVGRVTDTGPDVAESWHGRRVFAFNPHESRFCAPVESLVAVPDDCSATAATFLPNVEAAINFLQDGRPLVGERVAVFGQGVVGLLTTALLARLPLETLVTADCYQMRRERSLDLGSDAALDPTEVAVSDRIRERAGGPDADGADLSYELSGDPEALDSAISATGYDGRVVVGSWYGTKPAELDLGGRFHRSRVCIESSQVSTIDPRLRGRWTKERRLDEAWRRLREIDPERFVTHEFDVSEASEAYRLLDDRPEDALGVAFTY